MQGVHKLGIDLFFCLAIGLLTIQALNSLKSNEQLSHILQAESAKIAANSRK